MKIRTAGHEKKKQFSNYFLKKLAYQFKVKKTKKPPKIHKLYLYSRYKRNPSWFYTSFWFKVLFC